MFDLETIRRMNSAGNLRRREVIDAFGGLGATARKVANNTWEVTKPNGNVLIVYHKTVVVERYADGSVELSTGGWDTATTKDRINRFQSVGRVHSLKGSWVVDIRLPEGFWTYPFEDGMMIQPSGRAIGPCGTRLAGVFTSYLAEDSRRKGLEDAREARRIARGVRLGNLITRATEAWQEETDKVGRKDTNPNPCLLYSMIDMIEGLGLDRGDAWDLMDEFVHEFNVPRENPHRKDD